MFKFEELKVYQKSLDIIDEIYDLTDKFPKNEIFILTAQLLRAVNSIALNIAEGANSTDKVFNNHLIISGDSLKECIVCLTIARRSDYINEIEDNKLREDFLIIAKMITNLRKYLDK
ncbi:MAG TPA: four helix bundle protein [Flavobacteriaceae bacterium]|nr:four helix bundle protein [Flavobacteriaceae bacterium]